MWCWRRMEKISWTDCVKCEEVLHRVIKERNVVQTINRGKAKRIGCVWRRNCLLQHVVKGNIEGRAEVTERRRRRRMELLDYLNETRGYWKLKEAAFDRTVWRKRLWTCR
jgi:hypothetical protein